MLHTPPTGQNRYAVSGSNDNVVNCMLWNAATRASSFKPPCNGTLAVVLVACDNNNGNDPKVQPLVVNVPISCSCPACSCPGPEVPPTPPTPTPPPPPSPPMFVASGWMHKDAQGCSAQGCLPGSDRKRCLTTLTCPAPGVLASASSSLPCCSTCGSLGRQAQQGWFWVCRVPPTAKSYTWNIVSGDVFIGTCNVVVAGATVTISGCSIGGGWRATAASFYLSTSAPSTCMASGWAAPAGRSFTFPKPKGTGALGISTSLSRPSANTFLSLLFTLERA